MNINEKNVKRFYDDEFFKETFKVPGNFYSWALELLSVEKRKRLLDVGCGAGFLLRVAEEKGLSACGIDLSERAVKMAKQITTNSEILVGNAEKLPWKDCSFDFVTCLGTLEHLPHPDRGVKEIVRVLKKGARTNIIVPNLFSFVNIFKVYEEGNVPEGQPIEVFMTRKKWEKTLQDNGLKVMSRHKYNALSWKSKNTVNLLYRVIAPFIPLNLTYSFAFICNKT